MLNNDQNRSYLKKERYAYLLLICAYLFRDKILRKLLLNPI